MIVKLCNSIDLIISREAAEDAGFDVLRVISQPAAAALAYGRYSSCTWKCEPYSYHCFIRTVT